MSISTHVLDTARGCPAHGLPITLWREDGADSLELGTGITNHDGRIAEFIPDGTALPEGTYRIRFDTGAYFDSQGIEGFYPEVVVRFIIRAADEHYHVPLLISPFGFSTYRGS
ncbi:MAG: 5-hydroxyisourate hydrolase [Myxococcota bacterium]|jgi:5-hydroxyisourate hydrolase